MRIRTFVAAGAMLLAAHVLLADTPGGRAETRMVYDPAYSHVILFGGSTAVDSATKIAYDLDDTWEWFGDHWARRYTPHSPGARSGHAMVYDANRSRIVIFGGRRVDTSTKVQSVLSDTWIFQNNDWSQLATPNTPPARTVMGAAFDKVRDRIVMFGGNTISTDGKNTVTALHDTWEFDGTTWTQRGSEGPKVTKPIVVYDDATNQILLLGLDESSTSKTDTLMYVYDGAAGTWNQVKPEGLPTCVNEAFVTFDGETNSVILAGGVCASSDLDDTTFSWDGTKWTKLEVKTITDRAFGGTLAYDASRQTLLQYGGTLAFAGIRIGTFAFTAGDWSTLVDTTSPSPRALPVVFSFPGSNTIYSYGGHDESTAYDQLWAYNNGAWTPMNSGTNLPTGCTNAVGAFDSDRQKFVMACYTGNVWEFDGTTWKNIKDLKTFPDSRRFSSLAYDPTLKKTVLFGGYNEIDFINDTWTWDGTTWTKAKKNLPPLRGSATMWYDSTLRKTVLYGGVGRDDKESRIERYADMWTFDGNGWTDMKIDPAKTPGMRYGAASAIDPRNGHLLLYGGLVYTKDDKGVESQFYSKDLWEWNGSTWTLLSADNAPGIRENATLTYDPSTSSFLLFGGFAARYFGDQWLYDTKTGHWQPINQSSTGAPRRRAR